MKFSLAFLLVVSLAGTINSSPLYQKRSLVDDLDDFLSILPLEKIIPVVQEYKQNDKEVQEVMKYIRTEDFKKLIQQVESIEDVVNFLKYLQASGLDVIDWVNKLNDLIGLPHLTPIRRVAISGGMAGLVGDIKSLLPLEEIEAMYNDKLKTSEDFKSLIERLKSPKLQAIVDTLLANKEVQHILKTLKDHKVDVNAFFDLITKLLGIKFPGHRVRRDALSLEDDLADFLALIPQEEVVEIVMQYAAEDKEFQTAVDYVQSAEFRELVRVVELIDDVRNFYDYIEESGLDIYGAVNKLHEFIGLAPLTHQRSQQRGSQRITGGLNGLIQDIKAILPLDKIKALYHEKMQNSPAFQKLIERLNSPKFQAVVDTLFANQAFQEILKAAKEAGINVEKIADLLTTIFGLKFPTASSRSIARSLYVDLQDFLYLLPQEKIAEIFFNYMENDKQVQAIFEYMQSPEFRKLVSDVEDLDDVLAFYRYLDEAGLDIYGMVNELHNVIGLPNLKPRLMTGRISGGLSGLINDILAILPIEDLKALYYEKLEKSPQFQHLNEHLHSPKFQAVVNSLLANQEFKSIVKRAKAAGIDVKAVANLLSKLFGLHFPESRTLLNGKLDLEDFLMLLPFDEIAKIGVTYLKNDAEVQDAAKFIRTDEFKKLLMELQLEQDIADFLKYIEDSGLNVYDLIDFLNDFIGVPHYPRPLGPSTISRIGEGSGVQGMLNEIRAVLPYDQIRALYEKKLETSEDFRLFIERFKAPQFQVIIDRLMVNKKFVELGYQAHRHGIDIKHVTEFLEELFGLKFPEVPFPRKSPTLYRAASELSHDLSEFMELLPVDKIVEMVISYAIHDKETQETIEYIRSEEFKNIVRALDRIPEYNEILRELDAAGLDVYETIQMIHQLIGLDDKHPYLLRDAVIGKPGVSGLIEELKKILPYEQIKQLYYVKLEQSKAFANFIGLIKSDNFQAVTNTLFAHEGFQNLLRDAKAHGVDLQAISDFFARVFGIKTPPGIIDP